MREVNPAVSTLTQLSSLVFQCPICATYDFLYSPYPPSYLLHPFTRPDLDTLERPIRMTLAFLDLSPLYLSYHSHNFARLLNPLSEVFCNEKYLIEHPETCSFERLGGLGVVAMVRERVARTVAMSSAGSIMMRPWRPLARAIAAPSLGPRYFTVLSLHSISLSLGAFEANYSFKHFS